MMSGNKKERQDSSCVREKQKKRKWWEALCVSLSSCEQIKTLPSSHLITFAYSTHIHSTLRFFPFFSLWTDFLSFHSQLSSSDSYIHLFASSLNFIHPHTRKVLLFHCSKKNPLQHTNSLMKQRPLPRRRHMYVNNSKSFYCSAHTCSIERLV